MQIVTTSKKKIPDKKYSLVMALYCVGKNNEQVKFLYITDWSKEQFDVATKIYLSSIVSFMSNDGGAIRELLDLDTSNIKPALITWDETTKELIKVSAFPDHVRK